MFRPEAIIRYYLLPYLLTPCSRALFEKLICSQLVEKFPAFYRNRRFIAAFTRSRHLSLSWARSIQSISSHPTSGRSILILSSHLRLGSFSQFSPPKPCIHYYSPHTCYMPHPPHSSRFDHSNNIWWGVEIIKLLVMQFSPFPCYLVLLRTKYSPQHPILQHPPPLTLYRRSADCFI